MLLHEFAGAGEHRCRTRAPSHLEGGEHAGEHEDGCEKLDDAGADCIGGQC